MYVCTPLVSFSGYHHFIRLYCAVTLATVRVVEMSKTRSDYRRRFVRYQIKILLLHINPRLAMYVFNAFFYSKCCHAMFIYVNALQF